ncbi:hypothetical protein [Avibacterium sp. 20-129]|uniref:hypothetical protein n=1 Tax=Avibacterium sp. 20-129 TaxID=2911525 RepID=UPI0022472C62|nr:hypothetical protein [Avibacterium sp. 20-129]MCW9699864.1 hypothetical protein [Avibacterium sp. 20-129]
MKKKTRRWKSSSGLVYLLYHVNAGVQDPLQRDLCKCGGNSVNFSTALSVG